jgi:TolB-like protein
MMKCLGLIWAVCIAVGLAACASGVKYTEMAASLPPQSSEVGRIYFYRPAALAPLLKPNVLLNNAIVGQALSHGFFYVDRQPGEYEVANSSTLAGKLGFVLKKGESRYVRFTVIPQQMFENHVTSELIDQAVAQREIQNCKFNPGIALPPSAIPPEAPQVIVSKPAALATASAKEVKKRVEAPKVVVRGEKVKVGVIEFQNLNEEAKRENLGTIFSEMLTTSFVNSEAFKITEREQLQKVAKELQLSQTGIIDVTQAKEVGKMVGADAIVTGSVVKIGGDLRLDARIIDVQSGIILNAEKIMGKSDLPGISDMADNIVDNLVNKFYRNK